MKFKVQCPQIQLVAQLVKNPPAVQDTLVQTAWSERSSGEERLPTPVFLGSPGGSAGKESTSNEADLGSVAGLGRSSGEGNSYPFQYSGLENSMDCIVHGVTKSQTQLSKRSANRPAGQIQSVTCFCRIFKLKK